MALYVLKLPFQWRGCYCLMNRMYNVKVNSVVMNYIKSLGGCINSTITVAMKGDLTGCDVMFFANTVNVTY